MVFPWFSHDITIFWCFINLPQQWMLLISANICFMGLSEDTVPKKIQKTIKHPNSGGLSFKSSFSLSNSIFFWKYHPFSDPKFQFKFVKSSVFIGEILLFGLWNPREIPWWSTFAPTCCWTLPPGEVEKTGRSFQYQNNYIATSHQQDRKSELCLFQYIYISRISLFLSFFFPEAAIYVYKYIQSKPKWDVSVLKAAKWGFNMT